MQVVSYVADDGGYRAEVSYEQPEYQQVPNHTPIPPTYAPIHSTPVPPSAAYDHYDTVQYASPAVSSTAAGYYHQPQVLNVKIHSYNTAPHKQLLTKAIPSPAPAHLEHGEFYIFCLQWSCKLGLFTKSY